MNENFAKSLIVTLPKWIQSNTIRKNEITLSIYPEYITPFFLFLRDHSQTQYKVLVDITAVDFPSKEKRFEIVYNLLSIHHNSRLRIKTFVDEITPVDSIVPIYSAANWWERETWDMFGIFFF
jgi:NADH dehydrogenase (ubiquinone) Fe-S protein 3